MGESRNMILAIVIAIGILLLYQVFILDPAQQQREAAEAERAAAAGETVSDDAPAADPGDFTVAGDAPSGAAQTREQALAQFERVEIRTPALKA
jgi:hypothetical protein